MMPDISADVLKRYERKGRIIGAVVGFTDCFLSIYAFMYDFNPLPKMQEAPLLHLIVWILASSYVALICSHLGGIAAQYSYYLKEQVKAERQKFQSKPAVDKP